MSASLRFVLAPASALPEGDVTWSVLQAAQAQGPSGGFALRLFSGGPDDLSELPVDGRLLGDERRGSDGTQLLCDATVPRIDPQTLWLGVFSGDPDSEAPFRNLDRFPLNQANNDTCWFYPSHDGRFLSWERGLMLNLAPGAIADAQAEGSPEAYDRSRLAVLWSLLGDDVSLTCVGITYAGQRIDWPLRGLRPEPMATWSRFRVESQADVSLSVEESLTVFDEPSHEPPARLFPG